MRVLALLQKPVPGCFGDIRKYRTAPDQYEKFKRNHFICPHSA